MNEHNLPTVARVSTDAQRAKRPALLVWGVDPELKAEFRKACVDRNISMRKAVIQMLQMFIDGHV